MERRLFEQSDYLTLRPFVEAMGLILVEVSRDSYGSSLRYRVTITTHDNKATIKDCEQVHRMLQTRLTLIEEDRDLDLEVSTPGITRTLKDAGEFVLFTGSVCRVYDSDRSEWVRGIIAPEDAAQQSLTLLQAVTEDTREKLASYTIPYSRIPKAKLAYGWEDIT